MNFIICIAEKGSRPGGLSEWTCKLQVLTVRQYRMWRSVRVERQNKGASAFPIRCSPPSHPFQTCFTIKLQAADFAWNCERDD